MSTDCFTVNRVMDRSFLAELEAVEGILWSATDGAPGVLGVHTSPVMESVVEDLRRRFPDGARRPRPILCVLWSDGTALTHRLSGHPAVLKVANVSPELYHKRVRVPNLIERLSVKTLSLKLPRAFLSPGTTASTIGHSHWESAHAERCVRERGKLKID